MKIIDQSHEIINLPDNLLGMIEAAGRTCYKSEDKIGCTLSECHIDVANIPKQLSGHGCTGCSHHSSYKFSQRMLDRGHHAMIEFGDITVRFITNRGVTHELVRHRLFSFAQESTRYVNYKGGMEFIRPVWMDEVWLGAWVRGEFNENMKERFGRMDKDWLLAPSTFISSLMEAEHTYTFLLQQGWRPEQAREVLPNSLKTEIVVKGNIREWRHCLKLRTSKKAHPQIRALVLPLLAELKEKIPVVFDDI